MLRIDVIGDSTFRSSKGGIEQFIIESSILLPPSYEVVLHILRRGVSIKFSLLVISACSVKEITAILLISGLIVF